jgi:hypothetical protein
MTEVWRYSRHKGSALLLLLAIADHAHDDGGGAWPSQETLAKKTRLSVRQVRRLLDYLVAAGELKLEERPGSTALLTVLTGADKMSDPGHEDVRPPRTALDEGSTKSPTTPDTAVSDEPSSIRQEPSNKSSRDDDAQVKAALEELRGLEGYAFDGAKDRAMLVSVRESRPGVALLDEIETWLERGRKSDLRDERAALEAWLLIGKDGRARNRDARCSEPGCHGRGRGDLQLCIQHNPWLGDVVRRQSSDDQADRVRAGSA